MADPNESRSWRRLPVGAEPLPSGGVHFRVWAPACRRVRLLIEGEWTATDPDAGDGDEVLWEPEPARPGPVLDLDPEPGGYHSAVAADVRAGALYRFLLDDDPQPYPDPASRFQPRGPQGPSCVVDPAGYSWKDAGWSGVTLPGQVMYELHVGTFTPEGTWAAAARELPVLAELGITLIEVMPVADFPGRFGWGYDGVDWFAPTRLYGTPDDMRAFVDAAHGHGIGVILDVVYNHFGPDGNYLQRFAPHYLTDRHSTDWGSAINYDDADSGPVREFVTSNARHWIAEYHLDGLRLDATQDIHDDSETHIITELAAAARDAAGGRTLVIVAENEPQEAWLARPRSEGGAGLDAIWNDDFHHSARVAATGNTEGYFNPYRGTPQEFVSAARHGWLYQGQRYSWQRARRGTPTRGLATEQLVNFIQNHDQVANTGRGTRLHQQTSPGRYRTLTALLLLLPQTPLLFQGQEFAASSPFTFFADHKPELARLVARGRGEFLSQFASLAPADIQAALPDPSSPDTFSASRLRPEERREHAWAMALHRDLLRLRRDDAVLQGPAREWVEGAVLSPTAFVLRFLSRGADDRLLVVNLGQTLRLEPAPEPLLAPPDGMVWDTVWSSEHPVYGGTSTPPVVSERGGWNLPNECAVLLAAVPSPDDRRAPRDRRSGSERRKEDGGSAAPSHEA